MQKGDSRPRPKSGLTFLKWTWALSLIAIFIVSCATVPLTGRRQLTLISQPTLNKMGLDNYRRVLGESKLSQDREKVEMVNRIGRRTARAAERFLRNKGRAPDIRNYKWEFNLIEDSEQMNAWCMPGGKVAVYTGLLSVTENEAGLAVVLGHEIAHALAKHGNERMSQGLLAQMGGMALTIALAERPAATQKLFMTAYGLGAQVGVLLPYSRQQEYEADRIGLTLTAMAGYDPKAAVPLWQRMKAATKDGRPPEFLSTHPAPEARIRQIKRFIPEARRHYQAASP